MPGYCHDERPHLLVKPEAKEPEQPLQGNLPDPSPPPWLYCWTSPASFYDPLFSRARRAD